MLLALFDGLVGTVKSTVAVFNPYNKGWQYVCFTYTDHKNLFILASSSDDASRCDEFSDFIKNGLMANRSFTSVDTKSTATFFDKNALKLKSKLNLLGFKKELQLKDIKFADLIDQDALTGETLEDYIKANFNVSSKVKDFNPSNKSRKISFERSIPDFDKTWNSPYLTDEQKSFLRKEWNVDLTFANMSRDEFLYNIRLMQIVFDTREFHANMFHGVPAGGKTTMLVNCLAPLFNAPVLKLTGDGNMSLHKFFKEVLPKVVNGECVLTAEYSILATCFMHRLPLMVVCDEANYFKTETTSTLADVISSGQYNVGTEIFENVGNTLYWFFTFNPNSKKANEFDDKLKDRCLFFNIGKPTREEILDYRSRKRRSRRLKDSSCLSQLVADKFQQLAESLPEDLGRVSYYKDVVMSYISLDRFRASEKSIDNLISWYHDCIIDNRQLSFEPGEITDYYSCDVAPVSDDLSDEADAAIFDYIQLVNAELAKETLGIDTKNSNRNSVFYIPDRAYDPFEDLIHWRSSTSWATNFFIRNNLPSQNTLRSALSNDRLADNVPQVIADTITERLKDKADALDLLLFSDINLTELDKQYNVLFRDAKYLDCFNLSTTGEVVSPVEDTATVDSSQDSSQVSTKKPSLNDIINLSKKIKEQARG